jgi:hypothetical protein
MDFNDREMKVLLQALHRYRGEVSGATQEEQNKYASVEAVIAKIEGKLGPMRSEKTRFDREMDESLSVLRTGRAGLAKGRQPPPEEPAAAKAAGAAPAGKKSKGALDKGASPPKVKAGAPKLGAAKRKTK